MNALPKTLLIVLASLAATSFGQMSLAATGPEQAQLAANPDPASSKPTLSPASAKTIDRFERLDITAGIIADNETWSCVTDNQTALVWEVNTVQEMNFGGFVAEGGNATVTMSSTGGLTTSGPVSLSTSIPATTLTINVNNTLNSACATYGFTVELTRTPPRPLTGPGTTIGLDNVLLSIPVYNINNVNLPHDVDPDVGNTAPFTIKIHGRISVNDTNTDGEYSRGLNVRVILNGRRNSQRTTVTATSIVPLSIAENVPMNFGTVAGGSFPGTVILGTGNGRITTGDAQILATGPGNAATFEVAGEPNNSFSLSFSDGVLANGSGQQMNVTSFMHNSAGTIPGSGRGSFQVGATLNVGASQQPGTYSTSNAGGNPYSVIVNYN